MMENKNNPKPQGAAKMATYYLSTGFINYSIFAPSLEAAVRAIFTRNGKPKNFRVFEISKEEYYRRPAKSFTVTN